MENASKALIIAGAILLAIAIIGIGMFVYQSVSDTIAGAADMSKQQIDAYNGEFTTYAGPKQGGSQVKALCESVKNHNLAANDVSKLISVVSGKAKDPKPAPSKEGEKGTSTTDINKIKDTILSGKTYNVTVGYDKDTGLLTQIGIEEVK